MFGCPGKKAFDRRRDLGEVSGTVFHLVVLTEEDSGEEDTVSICQEIAGHVEENEARFYTEAAYRILRACDEKFADWDPEKTPSPPAEPSFTMIPTDRTRKCPSFTALLFYRGHFAAEREISVPVVIEIRKKWGGPEPIAVPSKKREERIYGATVQPREALAASVLRI